MTSPETEALTATLRKLEQSGDAITVRELISYWGAKGRGSQVSEQMRRDMRDQGLATEPPFSYGSLDTPIRVVTMREAETISRGDGTFHEPSSSERSDSEEQSETLHVGQIPSALSDLVSVESITSIGRAQTLMIQHDFSQLPVVDNGDLVGIISWESIAQASLRTRVKRVSDCVTEAQTLNRDADLLASMPVIVEAGYVIVLDPRGVPTGIVTTADLARQFDRLARPFLSVGECERELRKILDGAFSKEELHTATRYKKPGMPGASAMTVGDIKQFIAKPEVWGKLGLRLSHGAFVDWIEVVRQVRNDIAHFAQDDESIESLNQVRNLTLFLRGMRTSEPEGHK